MSIVTGRSGARYEGDFTVTSGCGKIEKIEPNGETRISAVLRDVKLIAIFQTAIEQISNDDEIPRLPQCTYSRIPCVVTRQIQLSVNGNEIFLPRSVFADLGDVTSAEFSRSQNGRYVLTVWGGDASESYILRILFDEKLRQRILYSGEDQSHPLQVTDYR
jgi:hypothetical protein